MESASTPLAALTSCSPLSKVRTFCIAVSRAIIAASPPNR